MIMTKMMMVFASSRLESGVGWNGGFSWRLVTPLPARGPPPGMHLMMMMMMMMMMTALLRMTGMIMIMIMFKLKEVSHPSSKPEAHQDSHQMLCIARRLMVMMVMTTIMMVMVMTMMMTTIMTMITISIKEVSHPYWWRPTNRQTPW